MYSQYKEDEIFLEYFGDNVGRLLEIGAYHPTILSNSRALIEKGWSGVLVEPSPECYQNIKEFYKQDKSVLVVNVAIGKEMGMIDFWNSEGAVATANEEHYNKWKNYQLDYKKIQVPCTSWNKFYKTYDGIYNFISIDAEGLDYDIISQINLDETCTELVCVEYTYRGEDIYNYLLSYGFKPIYQNGENIIMGR